MKTLPLLLTLIATTVASAEPITWTDGAGNIAQTDGDMFRWERWALTLEAPGSGGTHDYVLSTDWAEMVSLHPIVWDADGLSKKTLVDDLGDLWRSRPDPLNNMGPAVVWPRRIEKDLMVLAGAQNWERVRGDFYYVRADFMPASFTPVPEPSTLVLAVLMVLAGLPVKWNASR